MRGENRSRRCNRNRACDDRTACLPDSETELKTLCLHSQAGNEATHREALARLAVRLRGDLDRRDALNAPLRDVDQVLLMAEADERGTRHDFDRRAGVGRRRAGGRCHGHRNPAQQNGVSWRRAYVRDDAVSAAGGKRASKQVSGPLSSSSATRLCRPGTKAATDLFPMA